VPGSQNSARLASAPCGWPREPARAATRSYLGTGYRSTSPGGFAVYPGVVFGGISVGMAAAADLLATLGARGVLFAAGAGGTLAGAVGSVIYLARYRAAGRMLALIQAGPAGSADPEGLAGRGSGAAAAGADVV